MNILLWHVHGAWTTAFVHGAHDYFVPVLPDRSADGRGIAATYTWPENVHEVTPAEAAARHFDVVVLQRPHELDLLHAWAGLAPGRDIPAVYVEHNAPQGAINEMRHPMADRSDVTLVHVTHFNALYWDTGATPATVIEHGVVDPEVQYGGELARAAVVINEPVRRARVTGTDLLPQLAATVPLDVFGMGSESLGGRDLPQREMHAVLARRRVYVHPFRWTSLGLSLIEAMHIGLPVVAVAATEVPRAVPPGYPHLSTSPAEIAAAVRALIDDPEEAATRGKECREWARERYGLHRFLADWDALFAEVTS